MSTPKKPAKKAKNPTRKLTIELTDRQFRDLDLIAGFLGTDAKSLATAYAMRCAFVFYECQIDLNDEIDLTMDDVDFYARDGGSPLKLASEAESATSRDDALRRAAMCERAKRGRAQNVAA